ncbi:uncharacterized protein LOC131858444 [Cryptomeria japonica]|uniref:uncharacterized protein LOC131858444 n=1 Tax=Cryptomeria japonica TaxID=3369 RepID=UPI0027DA2BDF|nr:uncharacterized protein LOC131858444 [Cryptomeria japonica]
MTKDLGHFISKKWEEGLWKGVQIAAGVNPLTHLQFTNDTILAGDASAREARVIKETLDVYEKTSGQKVNWFKSEIFFSNTKPCKLREICIILGMKVVFLPGKYLGIPFFEGANKFDMWKNLIDSCINMMDGWKSRWHTSAGRILILRSVVSVIPIFSVMCLKLLKRVINVIQQRMKKSIWNGANDHDKIPLLAWDKIYQAKIKGGVGLRDWHKMNIALGAKLVWSIYTNPNQMWVKVLRAKYLDYPEDHRIFTIRDFSVIKDHLVQLWGDQVKDYMRTVEGDFGKEWVWKDLVKTGTEDRVIWCGAQDGNYSVKLDYQFLEGREENRSRI